MALVSWKNACPIGRTAALGILALLTIAGFPARNAMAQATGLNGFNQLLFVPTVGHSGLYTIDGSPTLPKRAWTVGLHFNLAKNVTNVTTPATGRVTEIIDSQSTADLHAGVGIFKFLEAGVNLPLVAYQTGTDFNTLQSYRTAAVGDLRFDLKARLLDGERAPIGVGFLSRATAPTGSRTKFTGDDGPTWEGRVLLDKRWRPLSLFANVGYRFTKAVTVLATTHDDLLTFGGGIAVPIPAGDRSWAFLAEAGGQSVMNDPSEISTPVEIRGGIRKRFASGLVLDLGGGGKVTNAYGSPGFRAFAGLAFNTAVRDTARRRVSGDTLAVQGVPGTKIRETFRFGFGRATVPPADAEQLRTIGGQLAAEPQTRLAIHGHADSTGPRAANWRLSLRRARAIWRRLVAAGARSEQLTVEAHGETQPAAPNTTPDGRRLNRRVEVTEE